MFFRIPAAAPQRLRLRLAELAEGKVNKGCPGSGCFPTVNSFLASSPKGLETHSPVFTIRLIINQLSPSFRRCSSVSEQMSLQRRPVRQLNRKARRTSIGPCRQAASFFSSSSVRYGRSVAMGWGRAPLPIFSMGLSGRYPSSTARCRTAFNCEKRRLRVLALKGLGARSFRMRRFLAAFR